MLTRKRARSARGRPESEVGDRSNALTPHDANVVVGVISPPPSPRPFTNPFTEDAAAAGFARLDRSCSSTVISDQNGLPIASPSNLDRSSSDGSVADAGPSSGFSVSQGDNPPKATSERLRQKKIEDSCRVRKKYADDEVPIKYQFPPSSQATSLLPPSATASGATLLPSSNAFDGAPVIGEDSDTNIIVRLANGLTLLQRLSPPCYQKVIGLRNMGPDGDGAKDALFKAASRSGLVSHNAIECGLSYDDGVHGWSAEHAQLAEEADTMVHWTWRYFHHHVYPLATLLDADLRVDLDRRRNPYDWFEKLLGPGQCNMTHHWWTSATVVRGEGAFTRGERGDTQNHQPAILVGFDAPFVLLVAHEHGLLKTVVRPGQVVIFLPEVPHRICPYEDEQDVKSSASTDSTSRSIPQAEGSKPRRSKKKTKGQDENGNKEFWAIFLTFSNDIFNKTRPPKVALRQRLNHLPLQPDVDEQRRYAKHPRFAKPAKTPFT